MIKRNSLEIIESFLQRYNIKLNVKRYLKKYLVDSDEYQELPDDIIDRIIADGYNQNSDLVKKIAEYFLKKYNIYFGRIQKEQLKKFIDYGFQKDLDILIQLIHQDLPKDLDIHKEIVKLIKDNGLKNDPTPYINNLKNAIKKRDEKRITDYLLFLYSRLVNLNERKYMSLYSIFKENEAEIRKELTNLDYLKLKEYCDDKTKLKREEAVKKFNSAYMNLLEKESGEIEKAGLIYFVVDQKLFDHFKNEKDFFSYLFELIKKAYSELKNHRTLAIKVHNIFSRGINIKWKIYSYLTIYAEKFRREKENRGYYKPWEICEDVLKHKFKIYLNEYDRRVLTDFYKNDLPKGYLKRSKKLQNKEVIETIEFFKKINYGFSFEDCFILKTDEFTKNSKGIEFIKNENELLLIFNKHQFDDRKIPCPVCGGLKISGNSYPQIGVKSWECKNPLCAARSKTNRGKRYSKRSILMQEAAFDFSKENQIPKELIKVWRKDVVLEWNYNSLYSMLVKYFTFVGDKIILLNAEKPKLFSLIASKEKRIPQNMQTRDFLDFSVKNRNEFDAFFNSQFFKLFLYKKDDYKSSSLNLNLNMDNNKMKIIVGDSYKVLELFKNKITNMVTSPPYYNAREYSKWDNLFNYLNDIYNIILKAHDALIKGGVFFYNIGDIFDNENIIVKSKMGEKRIPLGAYTILIFEKAGFELLDDIIWYKGEPQSNRHKNDGMYTPYYQRPTNCYEHMFIFKKEGDVIINKDKDEIKIKSNIIKFAPVVKIGKGGENRYGHTAPFPKMIPLLSISTFTNQGDIVLDPFSGSGTTPIVASINGRKAIGIEINKEYALLSIKKAKDENLDAELIDLN
ncbi:site-specific DNA-methyltransferase [Candidatus Aciduliprofundum boonei]|uniref:site-specific DNA-methyltransferase (cytosine-N(4)-specific) n=1 Tax=Aciduliprofundum boonei (strain DSM 19572 / T469) TaxID=439481 RepID=B5IH98_ACIB4|nr:site-specific DNA-methyltransferase [Candidatus Aciduliprofundum boonei]ADD08864.1 DNA methylase N-4/N-6 domain protein [Aciduliprofundum boonei T469]EDY34351.1 DNA methylase domain protein [Aciduliprofundum boonei T469]HII55617.1 site-specific DNA-methyltransferase [Candidatus Aciduliprofundum boonei]